MKRYFLVCLLVCLGLFSCKHYHNITAHYNAYFLAKEKMLEAEKRIYESRKDNYNRILYVFPLLDTNQLKGMKPDFDECIKKAAYAIERHEPSNWTDDAYIIVGKARFYNREFSDAINTFKYVNGTSPDKPTQEYALIELMRTYIEQGNFTDADIVKNYLRKVGVDKKNLAKYYLTQAHLYRLKKDYERTLKSLDLAIPEMPKGDKKARILFLHGQLHQKLKNDAQAFKSYQAVLKNKPSYEMELQARLAMLLTGDSATVYSPKTQRQLEKMLKDFKNQEYLDEIYYDLAMLELKRKKYTKAVELLIKSSQAKGTGGQKPYTYLRLAEIHFDKLRRYEEAKAYYDTTMMFLPKDEEGYEKIAKRHEVLDEFIKHLKVYQLEDSLQRMAKMSENELEAYLEENISRQVRAEKARQKAIEQAKKKAELNNQPVKGTLQEEKDRQNSEWYFDNPTQVEAGKREFRQKWGNRPLADNWRRIAGISSEIDENAPKEMPSAKEQAKEDERAILTEIANRKRGIKVQIPYSEAQMKKSLMQWENAALNLAKLYHFQLEEYSDAEITYWEIVKRIDKSQYEAEVYYLLYVLYKSLKETTKAQEVRNLLQSKYPNSVYAKLVDNPNYLIENQAKDEAAQVEYARIYETLYEQKKYKETIEALEQLKQTYPENTIADKIEALRIICLGRTSKDDKQREQFDLALEEFVKKFPDSKLSEILKAMNQRLE